MTSKAEELRKAMLLNINNWADWDDTRGGLVDAVNEGIEALTDYAKSLEAQLADRRRSERLDTANAWLTGYTANPSVRTDDEAAQFAMNSEIHSAALTDITLHLGPAARDALALLEAKAAVYDAIYKAAYLSDRTASDRTASVREKVKIIVAIEKRIAEREAGNG